VRDHVTSLGPPGGQSAGSPYSHQGTGTSGTESHLEGAMIPIGTTVSKLPKDIDAIHYVVAALGHSRPE